VGAAITDEIRNGALRLGERIPTEVEQIKQLALSRSVREVISRLTSSAALRLHRFLASQQTAACNASLLQLKITDVRDRYSVAGGVE
jgi:hypothetical protein